MFIVFESAIEIIDNRQSKFFNRSSVSEFIANVHITFRNSQQQEIPSTIGNFKIEELFLLIIFSLLTIINMVLI